MKNNFFNKTLIIILLAVLTFGANYGQENNDAKKKNKLEEIRNIINSKHYAFIAQMALPMGRSAINLTSPYNLKVSGDTVVSDLPYFGRAYVASMDPSDAGFQFTSTRSGYSLKQRKKGGWDILILPKDAKDVRQISLTFTEDGFGTLQVISNNRQSIGYNGYIVDSKKK